MGDKDEKKPKKPKPVYKPPVVIEKPGPVPPLERHFIPDPGSTANWCACSWCVVILNHVTDCYCCNCGRRVA